MLRKNRLLGSMAHANNLANLEAADGRKPGNHSVTAWAQSHPPVPAGGPTGRLRPRFLACALITHAERCLIIQRILGKANIKWFSRFCIAKCNAPAAAMCEVQKIT